ncbi:type I-MYXAN CRISPR-associated protein Cas6/Cmx6 [Candidatus Albibeggiatoa sp. nov. NOAA]|uniref:type I-MYXAN CRISPR-associated protein Cas6/Cmx6 n=1 Tax=Candidatus Albibeggiatoa sp. nov. NOAA TaxID=3162724 RepID=UPI0032F77955|nr:type I-MYXAN CRISPR-associated protein Cas6/Cmx6 [Thiotrichaceae bacterium]
MLWQEEEEIVQPADNKEVVDVVFDISCKMLPVDHAYALSQAIMQALPWFADEPLAGLHLIHSAPSGNGWQRPESQDELMYLSRRTKLTLRLPVSRTAEAQVLTGQAFDIHGYELKVGKTAEKPLIAMPVLLAHHIVADEQQTEDDFIMQSVKDLTAMGVECRKALCGKSHYFKTPDGNIFTRSLMIADISPADAITVQQQGLGEGRNMGFGIFMPHKDIAPVNVAKQDNKTTKQA